MKIVSKKGKSYHLNHNGTTGKAVGSTHFWQFHEVHLELFDVTLMAPMNLMTFQCKASNDGKLLVKDISFHVKGIKHF